MLLSCSIFITILFLLLENYQVVEILLLDGFASGCGGLAVLKIGVLLDIYDCLCANRGAKLLLKLVNFVVN